MDKDDNKTENHYGTLEEQKEAEAYLDDIATAMVDGLNKKATEEAPKEEKK